MLRLLVVHHHLCLSYSEHHGREHLLLQLRPSLTQLPVTIVVAVPLNVTGVAVVPEAIFVGTVGVIELFPACGAVW